MNNNQLIIFNNELIKLFQDLYNDILSLENFTDYNEILTAINKDINNLFLNDKQLNYNTYMCTLYNLVKNNEIDNFIDALGLEISEIYPGNNHNQIKNYVNTLTVTERDIFWDKCLYLNQLADDINN
jgi:hypothetical protein